MFVIYILLVGQNKVLRRLFEIDVAIIRYKNHKMFGLLVPRRANFVPVLRFALKYQGHCM